MEKIWFITGSARGLGKSITEAALAAGDKVAATARNPEQLNGLKEKYFDRIYPLALDVTDEDQIALTVELTIQRFGRIDILVNNAGFGITGAAEAFTDEQVRSQLETNLYAPIAITRAVLPYMRRQRQGRIMQISSIGGRVGTGGVSIYQAAKFGLTGFSEALAKETAPLGIWVTSIEPGGIRTDWAGASMTYAVQVEGYESTVDKRANYFKSGYTATGDPDKMARVIVDLANHPQPPVHLILGSDAAGLLKNADQWRKDEFEKWMPVSLSTDHDDAVDFFKTEAGKWYAAQQK